MGLIVADTGNSRLLLYRARDDSLYLNEAVAEFPQLRYPSKVQVNPQGAIYALDQNRLRIAKLNAKRQFESFPANVDLPTSPVKSFALDRTGNLYTLHASGLVRVFDPQGKVHREIDSPDDDVLLSDITVDPNGRVLTVDCVEGVIYAAGQSENLLVPVTEPLKQYARFPSRITTDDRGRIYLSDRNGCRIVVLGQDGSFLASGSTRGWKEGLLQFPAQIFIEGETLFIADTRNHRVQVFTISE
jgi:hypothetical protein